MDNVLKTFPKGTNKGYVFASFLTSVPIKKVVDYIKEHGSYLSLGGEFKYDGNNSRTVNFSSIPDTDIDLAAEKYKFVARCVTDNEVIMKVTYEYDENGRSNAINDADSLIQHIEKLIQYAEKANPYFANRTKSSPGVFKRIFC